MGLGVWPGEESGVEGLGSWRVHGSLFSVSSSKSRNWNLQEKWKDYHSYI